MYEARKSSKKLRALVRLVRDEIGEKSYRLENTTFRDAVRPLSPVRDAEVLVYSLELLEPIWPPVMKAFADQAHEMNRAALARLRVEKDLVIVPGATHLFEEPGALEQVARLARDWFVRWLPGSLPHGQTLAGS